MTCRVLLLVCLVVPGPVNRQVLAANSRQDYQPLCGAYCLYMAMRIAGSDVKFVELIKPEYVGSRRGSSMQELYQAATDYGMHAKVVANLSTKGLRRSRVPMLLHTKRDASSLGYDHFILFLGTTAGRARIYDPPETVNLVPFAEIARQWNGLALIVCDRPIDTQSLYAPQRWWFFVYACIALGAILTLRQFLLNMRPSIDNRATRHALRHAVEQGFVILLLAASAALVYNMVSDEGLLVNASATARMSAVRPNSSIPRVGLAEFRQLAEGGAVLVDARYEGDFEAGHLPGAVNVPVHAGAEARAEAMRGIPKDVQVVVYCQSARCRFAETVAARLVGDGYSHVLLFEGGWREWLEGGRDQLP